MESNLSKQLIQLIKNALENWVRKPQPISRPSVDLKHYIVWYVIISCHFNVTLLVLKMSLMTNPNILQQTKNAWFTSGYRFTNGIWCVRNVFISLWLDVTAWSTCRELTTLLWTHCQSPVIRKGNVFCKNRYWYNKNITFNCRM